MPIEQATIQIIGKRSGCQRIFLVKVASHNDNPGQLRLAERIKIRRNGKTKRVTCDQHHSSSFARSLRGAAMFIVFTTPVTLYEVSRFSVPNHH